MTRLQRFRAFMARMNPIADPRLAIRDRLYVAPPGVSTAEMITRSMELEPSSSHLVVGGIGSGKTSDLLVAAKSLRASLAEEGDHAEYIDVSKRHDLAAPRLSGVLLALVGGALSKRVPKDANEKSLLEAVEALENHANGFTRWEPYEEEREPPDEDEWGEPGRMVRVPGVLVPPERTGAMFDKVASALHTVRDAYPGDGKQAVFLVDSLDRLESAARFREAVQDDLKWLKRADIGLVLVGPARFISGTDRSVLDLFDHVHFHLAVDPLTDEGADFLTKVLRARADAEILPDECVQTLILASGGTLRDLISLGKRAGEEAYAAGHSAIQPEDAAIAVDAFGRSLAVGLDKDERKVLARVRTGRGLSGSSETELSLIGTRRVLLYPNNEWRVHPALVPVLKATPDA